MDKININIEEALRKTIEISKKEKERKDTFSKYAPIYMGPTGNVKDMIRLYKEKMAKIETALVVGSQGSFSYELAINCSVKKIDCFDINILQYLFFMFYDTAIQICEYPDFIRNFTSIEKNNIQRLDTMLSDWIFFDILENMSGIAREYWEEVYKKIRINSLMKPNLFRTYYTLSEEYLKKYSSVYDAIPITNYRN